jgi:hypothetical protein
MVISTTFLLTCTCVTAIIVSANNCRRYNDIIDEKGSNYWGWVMLTVIAGALLFGGAFLGALLQKYI